jgi:hypothetical protein
VPRGLTAVLAAAVAVSVVHYVDNYTAYEAFPQLEDGPTISKGLVAFGWFFFTAFGAAGYLLARRGRERAAAGALAVYSGSGLVGIGHYLAPGMTDAVWWRQAHVVADILLGAAVLALALRMVAARPARA